MSCADSYLSTNGPQSCNSTATSTLYRTPMAMPTSASFQHYVTMPMPSMNGMSCEMTVVDHLSTAAAYRAAVCAEPTSWQHSMLPQHIFASAQQHPLFISSQPPPTSNGGIADCYRDGACPTTMMPQALIRQPKVEDIHQPNSSELIPQISELLFAPAPGDCYTHPSIASSIMPLNQPIISVSSGNNFCLQQQQLPSRSGEKPTKKSSEYQLYIGFIWTQSVNNYI